MERLLLHTECRADERPNGPHRGPVMPIKAVRLLVGASGAGPRPHLAKSYLSDTFHYRGETIKGATPPLPPLALPPLKVFIGHNSNFG